ncbi:MAG: putative serine/threonine protein kinase, partial [Streblomastix strix]
RGWEYTAQITRALDHLHSHNVMHRDLKPANILVNQDGTIRLGDFGLSRELNDDYYLTIAGTKVYMAPEVHLLKRMDKSSDIFSLGVIIFQLITGHHPYEADSEEAMIDKIKKNQDPSHRPTTKMILSNDTVLMSFRLFGGLQQSKQEKIDSLNERNLLQEELNRIQTELIRERTEKDQEKRRADLAVSEKELLQVELDRERQERDQEKRRADTEHAEVIRLTAEVLRLNQSLLQAITVNLQVPSGMNGHKDANRFTHDSTNACCTISTDPIISEGIVYYESEFEKHDGGLWSFGIGIADSSVVFKPNYGPGVDGNGGKTVSYYSDGHLWHINQGPPNQRFYCGQRIGAEVNMLCRPRRLTFFVDDVEQKYYIINIPEAIRFWSFIYAPYSSFTVTRFERRSSSSAHGVTGSIGLEWGKEWPKDECRTQ